MNFEFDLPSICHFKIAAHRHRQGDGKWLGNSKSLSMPSPINPLSIDLCAAKSKKMQRLGQHVCCDCFLFPQPLFFKGVPTARV